MYEAADTIGGGTRSAEVTLPGYVHDICASVHPSALKRATMVFQVLALLLVSGLGLMRARPLVSLDEMAATLLPARAVGGDLYEVVPRLGSVRLLIGDVRGKGLFVGVELDFSAGKSAHKSAADVVNRCLERGLLINGTQGNIVRLAPALTITQAEMDEGLGLLESVLTGK